jgi:biotin operon repressor/anti-sigma regulatory factor (Ser/Thr protein kinase)
MDKKEKILGLIKQEKTLSGPELAEILGVSRQAVNRHLQKLMQEGLVTKEGVTRGTVYSVSSARKKSPSLFRKNFILSSLEEDVVFQDIALALNLKKELSLSAYEIVQYAFTEILNNAIDHSMSENCRVELMADDYNCQFTIRDFGIGLFYSIFNKFNLSDENDAVGDLIKGKTTTMPKRHTGEGIFFTSKAADVIFFRSHKIELVFDNQRSDIFVAEKRKIQGTEVVFKIKKRSRKNLDKIFTTYAPEEFDYKFQKTKAYVKLYHQEYVSRSEAKRLLYGLDKFKEVVLDFKGVKSIGQGFADEIFRIFMQNHTAISISVENLSPALKQIIKHVIDNKISDRLTIG